MKHERRWRRRLAASVCLFLVGAVAACTVKDGELGRLHGLDGGANGCGFASPLVQVQGRPTCAGRLAASHFSNALCSCANVQLASSLVTRGFDSRQGPFQEPEVGGGGASVGVNGSYLSFEAADIAGAFSIAGPAEVVFRGALSVRGDFWAAGNVSAFGLGVVARNAWFGGNLVARGPFTVAGALHHSGTVSAFPLLAGSDQPGAVSVPKPCACEPGDLLDVAGIVDAARVENDNGLAIPADSLTAVSASRQWILPCGRTYLTGIGGRGDLLIHVSGMSALFIDGSIDLDGKLVFDVAPGAEVDVFVKNDVATEWIALASKERPATGRLWVGGAKPIVLGSPWVGNLYAPRASVATRLGLEVWGSLFVGDFSGDLAATVTYDRSIAESGATCTAPAPAAGECKQCGVCSGGSACVSGSCGACSVDSDCCSLTICANGRCAPWLDPQKRP